jgi:tetratricopeptide (TPR) repeat protein
MKKIITLCVLFAFVGNTHAQKTKSNKPPTAAEMQAMMKEAQKQMQKLDPATKKMMDSMGIKIPTISNEQIKGIGKISDKQIADAYEDSKRIVPKKDDKKIGSIAKEMLTNASIISYLQSIDNALIKKFDNKIIKEGDLLIEKIKEKYTKNIYNIITSYASTLWTMNQKELALYLMSKACIMSPLNAQNLNNYASFLSMGGAPQIAIPILNKLIAEVKNNSTVLNNLGQAWFQLGDIVNARKYLDACLKAYPTHSQANATTCLIEESKGNKQEAIAAMKKSLKEGFNDYKTQKLSSLGYRYTDKDFTWNFKKKDDGLGMGRFTIPNFPMNVDECDELEPIWEEFKAELQALMRTLEAEIVTQGEIVKIENDERIKLQVKSFKENRNYIRYPLFLSQASKKMGSLQDEHVQKMDVVVKAMQANDKQFRQWHDEFEIKMEALSKEDLAQSGEGMPNKDFCPQYKAVRNEFLQKYNTLLQSQTKENLVFEKNFYSEMLNVYLNVSLSEASFNLVKLETKKKWLFALYNIQPEFKENCTPIKKKLKKHPIPRYEDINCNKDGETIMWMPMVGKLYTECNKLKLDIEIEIVGIGGKYNRELDFVSGKETSTLFIGYSKGFIDLPEGAMGVAAPEAKIEAGAFVEFGENGITDSGIKAEGKVETGIIKGLDGYGTSGTITGIESKLSWNTGFTARGTGIVEGIELKNMFK